jgi:hypothetical protein
MPRSLIFGREIQYSDTFHCSKPALNGLWKTDTKFAKCRQLPGGADQRKKPVWRLITCTGSTRENTDAQIITT